MVFSLKRVQMEEQGGMQGDVAEMPCSNHYSSARGCKGVYGDARGCKGDARGCKEMQGVPGDVCQGHCIILYRVGGQVGRMV